MHIILIGILVILLGKFFLDSTSFYQRLRHFIENGDQEFMEHLPFTSEIIKIGFRRTKIILMFQATAFLFFLLFFVYSFIPQEWVLFTAFTLILNAIFIGNLITMMIYAKQDWTQKKLLYNEESVMFRGIRTLLISNQEEEVKFFETNNKLCITGKLSSNDERRREYFQIK